MALRKNKRVTGPDEEYVLSSVMSVMNQLEVESQHLDQLRYKLNLVLRQYGVRLPRYKLKDDIAG